MPRVSYFTTARKYAYNVRIPVHGQIVTLTLSSPRPSLGSSTLSGPDCLVPAIPYSWGVGGRFP